MIEAQYLLVLDGHICNVGTDGEIITKGSKEQMQRLADSLMEDYPMTWEVVPLEKALQKYPPHSRGQRGKEREASGIGSQRKHPQASDIPLVEVERKIFDVAGCPDASGRAGRPQRRDRTETASIYQTKFRRRRLSNSGIVL